MASEIGSASFNETVAEVVLTSTTSYIDASNASFVLQSGYLVFMMQLGFALLTIGCIGAKSAKSVSLKNLMDASAGGVGYFLFGYAFAYGDSYDADGNASGNPFIGSKLFALSGLPQEEYYKWLFQFVFAISTATIISGAVAERLKFTAYFMYAFFMTAWVYPVLTHWIWSPTGWASTTRTDGTMLLGSGAYDTVGSGAVHMCGGVAGLAGAWVAGPRRGRFINGKPQPMPGHNSVYYMTGVLLLWFGFYGFNPGTMGQIIAADGTDYSILVARCAISTSMGGCFGAVTGLLLYYAVHKIRTGHDCWDLHQAGNGALVGMIVITSGCSVYEPWASALGGIVGGLICYPSSLFFSHICKIDDPVDAVTVHMTGGAVGVWYMALFAKQGFVYELYGDTLPNGNPRKYGWFMGDDATLLGANTIWVLTIFGWTACMMVPFFYLLKLMGQLRVSPEDEARGADLSHHGGSAYPGLGDHSQPNAKSSLLENGSNGDYSHKVEQMEVQMSQMAEELRALKKQTTV